MTRPDLMALLGQRVTITNPSTGSTWTGTLAALSGEPCAVIDEDDGSRFCIPQSFTIAPADKPPASAKRDQHIAKDGDLLANLQAVKQSHLLDRLDGMLANLTAHIEQRAAEVAQPLIAKAREAALTDIERAQHKQQRAEDLVAELRRRIRALDRTVERYRNGAAAADTAISELEERAALAEQRAERAERAEAQHVIPIEESRDGEIQAALDSLAAMNRITRTTAEDVRDVVHALRLAGYRVVRYQEANRG